MKKIFSILIVFILIISTANIVFADGLTLAELKAETPERLIMNVTTKNGEVVEVDAPIILPDVDNIPTLLAKRMTFDTSNVGKDFPVMKGENQCVNVASQYWNYDGSPFISFETYPDGKKSKRNGVLDAMKREMLPLGTISVENDITVDYINELMKKIVTKYSKDEVPEFRVLRPILYSGLYYTKMERCKNKDFKMIQYPVANKNKPVKNRTRELWSVYFAQNIEGVEVFTGQYRLGYDNYHCHKPGFVAEGWIELLSEKDFLFSACAFKKLDVIKEKNLFASFESLKSKLEDRIKN
ncbi:MAG: hypothetical protein GYA87_06630, partial [Christensenellaceae bacterium]|nr:hypothetical protein [Christensenellaceae bacterium]